MEPVLCVTPTYGRSHLLQEMLWCWLAQTYENKRLLIVNDQHNLTIECSVPGVTVINVPERFPGLGAKRNFIAKHIPDDVRYVVTMDDDDLFLPDHITKLVAALPDTMLTRSKSRVTYVAEDNVLSTINTSWPCYGASCFHAKDFRSFWMQDNYNWAEDVDMLQRHRVQMVNAECGTFIYRRGMNIFHASGNPGMMHHDDMHQRMVHQKIRDTTRQYAEMNTLDLTPCISEQALLLYREIERLEQNK